MKLRADQLAQHTQQVLLPIYFVSGDEPFQMDQACTAIREAASAQGYSDRQIFHVDNRFDWNELTAASQSLSLFAERRLIELRLQSNKLGEGTKALTAYAQQPAEDTIVLVVSPKLESAQTKSKWLGAVQDIGALVQVWPVDVAQLPSWIKQRMQLRGMQPTPEAVQLLAERVEGNLLAADQELEKLRLLCGEGTIDAEQVMAAVTDSARYDVFGLVDAALAGQSERVVRIVHGLRAEGVEAVILVWALSRELRSLVKISGAMQQGKSQDSAMREHGVWQKRIPVVGQALKRCHQPKAWQAMLWDCGELDKLVKGQRAGTVWDELLQLALRISGQPLLPRNITRVG